jgi:hypothetical protein
MARKIDTDAEIYNIRLKEQAGDVVAVDAGYFHAYMKETGMYWEDDAEIVAGPIGAAFEPGGRLTLTTGTPVTTADVTAAATLYYTPYKHDMISLYDGARWIPKTFAELSLNIAAYTASKPYDIWAYLNSGAVALDSTVWTNATTRATALAYQNGRYVKSGAATRLYLGTIYVNSSGGQTDDSVTKRNVFNYYNRVRRYFSKADANSHTYNSTTIRYWNNDTTLLVEYMLGVVEDVQDWQLYAQINASNAASPTRALLTYDGSTSIDVTMPYATNADTIPPQGWAVAATAMSAIGRHTVGIMEYITASTNNGTFAAARLFGSIWA